MENTNLTTGHAKKHEDTINQRNNNAYRIKFSIQPPSAPAAAQEPSGHVKPTNIPKEQYVDFEPSHDEPDFDEASFDAFLEMLAYEMNQPRTFILNPKRMRELEVAYTEISKIVLSISPDAKIECTFSKLGCSSASISVEADELIVEDIKAFVSVAEKADNFEIYPLTNGHLRMAFMFRNVMNELTEPQHQV
ncbi:MAG: hypothetical protein GX111_04420 [Clostridiales bacterium]|nr:hypothetical protein [Clostridiales bacterium]